MVFTKKGKNGFVLLFWSVGRFSENNNTKIQKKRNLTINCVVKNLLYSQGICYFYVMYFPFWKRTLDIIQRCAEGYEEVFFYASEQTTEPSQQQHELKISKSGLVKTRPSSLSGSVSIVVLGFTGWCIFYYYLATQLSLDSITDKIQSAFFFYHHHHHHTAAAVSYFLWNWKWRRRKRLEKNNAGESRHLCSNMQQWHFVDWWYQKYIEFMQKM